MASQVLESELLRTLTYKVDFMAPVTPELQWPPKPIALMSRTAMILRRRGM